MKSKTIQFLLYLYLSAVSGVALASGNHHAGHEHGSDDEAMIGQPGTHANVDRVVEIDMNDEMRYVPGHITVKQGETIKFLLKNSGETEHEFVMGTENELMEHYELMKKFPGMEHEDANQVRVDPGQVGEVIWQFTKSGKIDFGCLMPGHYEAGMKGVVSVETAAMNSDEKETMSHSHEGHQQ